MIEDYVHSLFANLKLKIANNRMFYHSKGFIILTRTVKRCLVYIKLRILFFLIINFRYLYAQSIKV